MPLRCYLIRLDANTERPWIREGFRVADLEAHVHEHRPELLAAALTMIRGWYVDGCPKAAVPRIGGFDSWAQTIGSVLAHAGIQGFLANLDQLAQVRDEQGQQWARFVDAWWYEYGATEVTTADLYQSILVAPNGQHDGAIPDALLVQRDRGPGAARRSLGMHLSRLAGRVFDGRKLMASKNSDKKIRLWRLQPLQDSQEMQRPREKQQVQGLF